MIVVIKKRRKDYNIMKTDFYSYKNGKIHKICKECFNIKLRCEFFNKELNKCYLRSHIKKQHIEKQHLYQQFYNQHTEMQQITKIEKVLPKIMMVLPKTMMVLPKIKMVLPKVLPKTIVN